MAGRLVVESLSRAVDHHRRAVIIAAALLTAAATVAAVRFPAYHDVTYPGLLGAFLLIFTVALVMATVLNRRRPHTFDIVDGGFATPRLGVGVLMIVSLLPLLGFGAAVGRDGISAGRDRWFWILGLLAAAGLWACWVRPAWTGTGVRLTRDGLTADGMTGSMTVPWDALDRESPAARIVEIPPPAPAVPDRDPVRLPSFARLVDDPDRSPPPPVRTGTVSEPENFALHLSFARPELVQRRGWTLDARRISYEGTDDDFLAAAIGHYAANPGERHTIGTAHGLARLRAALPVPPPAPDPAVRPVLEPGTTATGVVVRIAVIVSGLGLSAAEQLPGWLQWTGHAVVFVTTWNLGAKLHLLSRLRRVTRRRRVSDGV